MCVYLFLFSYFSVFAFPSFSSISILVSIISFSISFLYPYHSFVVHHSSLFPYPMSRHFLVLMSCRFPVVEYPLCAYEAVLLWIVAIHNFITSISSFTLTLPSIKLYSVSFHLFILVLFYFLSLFIHIHPFLCLFLVAPGLPRVPVKR